MRNRRVALALLLLAGAAGGVWVLQRDRDSAPLSEPESPASGYSGSARCRVCHEGFYEKWASSHHGLAMRPYSDDFARRELVSPAAEISIGDYRYRAEVGPGGGWVRERGAGAEKRYRITQVLGGKNVYYFLTPMERGRLQVLPVAFDVRERQWFDTTASMVRHFPHHPDEALDWHERPLTFNTSCFNCHVSQLRKNYDLETDTYTTVWTEPGINCETCHGPAGEHLRVCEESTTGEPPADLKIIRAREFTVEQRNEMCAPCHAKMNPLTDHYRPGSRFFDYFNLVTLEDRDFYPDGRDLGENYTYTLWLTSPCAASGKLDCLHCHTSSGRYRFHGERANDACLPCHREHVEDATFHTHHPADSKGNRCVACHMPTTIFARMARSDHSMRPPTPSATIEFGSPNACNLCHTDRDAAWADRYVRQWRSRDYQARVLQRAALLRDARRGNWTRLEEMLDSLLSDDRDPVYATSLIRLLSSCGSRSKWPVFLKVLRDPSPLVRSAAARALGAHLTPPVRDALLEATVDDYRLVRLEAAAALVPFPREGLDPEELRGLERASGEFVASLRCRPDDHLSHYNLGNYYLGRNELHLALDAFEVASRLDPTSVLPLVNASLVHARLGDADRAERSLREALRREPSCAEASFNLGLLLAERGDLRQAERRLRAALTADPAMAPAAYNLCVLLADARPAEAIELCREAVRLRPYEPRYAFSLAFYLHRRGKSSDAIETLRAAIGRASTSGDVYALLGRIHEEQGRSGAAIDVYHQATADENLPPLERHRFAVRAEALSREGG